MGYTIEASWVVAISMLLIMTGILVAFDVFQGDISGICRLMKQMPEIAGCEAADRFRLADTVTSLIGQ